MTAIHNWFRFCDLDDASSDTDEVIRLTALGNDLLAIADVHLALMTNTTKPSGPATPPAEDTFAYVTWMTLTSQMASELYFKTGSTGLTSDSALGVTQKYSMEYSPALMKMILGRKKLLAMA